MLNPVLFVLLGAYLQAAGLVRNWKLRREGRTVKSFRTVMSLGRMSYESAEFSDLDALYAAHFGPEGGPAPVPSAEVSGTRVGSRSSH